MYHLPAGYPGVVSEHLPVTGQFTLEAEFMVIKYFGIGFSTGVGGHSGGSYLFLSGIAYGREINVPLGAIANFHFFQFAVDKSQSKKAKLVSEYLDIYLGASAGAGIAIYPRFVDYVHGSSSEYKTVCNALLYAGPHIGLHAYLSPVIGVRAEFGYGKTLASLGMTFRFIGDSEIPKHNEE
jgi:hypothetical protein